MNANITRDTALAALLKYNSEPYHIQHALTVESVMRYFAQAHGLSADETEFWSLVGLLHDIDFEQYPDEHCLKAPELLHEIGASNELIHSICTHCWGYTTTLAPVDYMEKVLFATDELTGIIAAAVRLLPSRSVLDAKESSILKKFKNAKFAAGCDREVIRKGADMLKMSVDMLIAETLHAMQKGAIVVDAEMNELFPA